MRAIIIDSGTELRRLDARQSLPRGLSPVDDTGRPVIEWILNTLQEQWVSQVVYVGGYHIEKVISRYPDFSFRYLPPREAGSELAALLAVEPDNDGLIAITTGTILLPGALKSVPDDRITCATYGKPPSCQMLNLLVLPKNDIPAAFTHARKLAEKDGRASLADLGRALMESDGDIAAIDLEGKAAPVDNPTEVARVLFRGKAQALEALAPISSTALVLDSVRVPVGKWRTDPEEILSTIAAKFGDETVILRSATTAEDSLSDSGAGRFLSLMDVSVGDRAGLTAAIDQVIESFSAGGREVDPEDEVLIQKQIMNLTSCGVLLTREPNSAAPYFVINVDRESGRSDLVTAGAEGQIETYYVAWDCPPENMVPAVARIVRLARELIHLSSIDMLDIEFGEDAGGQLYLFQVRPLTVFRNRTSVSNNDLVELVMESRQFVRSRQKRNPRLLGKTSILGTMPDWNPVEMIGRTPRSLALSLYQLVIGNGPWAVARTRIGYRDVAPEPLILSVGGRPYVDVRCSLNSFLPASLPDPIGEKWVCGCLDRIETNPELHDKIEFGVAITCLAPDWPEASTRLAEAGLLPDEIEQFRHHIGDLTQKILRGEAEPVSKQLDHLETMAARRERLLGVDPENNSELAYLIQLALEDCREYGTVPFSILARYAFIALTFLKGLVARGVLDEETAERFQRSLPTVAGGFSDDLIRYHRGKVDIANLAERYGHLRPNSYEITSPNYRSDPAKYFRPIDRDLGAPPELAKDVLLAHASGISAILDELELDVSVEQLVTFMAEAIPGREFGKFEFMKNINLALESVARLGENLGLARDVMSHLPISEILRLATDSEPPSLGSHFIRTANFNEKRWELTKGLLTPELICAPDDLLFFRLERWRANFVTRERIVARLIWLDQGIPEEGLDGAIVVIRAADPGYDWIFGHRIAGMITQYGGVASHMAIRAAEFGLPAAIGCGSAILDGIRDAALVELDCGRESIKKLR